MSQSSQALRTRIKSVNSTKKITKAMEMIANAKLVRSRNKMEANREYAQRLQDTVDEIAYYNPDVENKFVQKAKGEKTLTIIFCSLNCSTFTSETQGVNAKQGLSIYRINLFNFF